MSLAQARAAALQDGVVVVGAGQAGGRLVEALRRNGFTGKITLIGDERVRPYERPSLSKEMLHDPEAETITWVHEADFYQERDVALVLEVSAVSIDRAAREVRLSDGGALAYGVLVLATGARPRLLDVPGAEGKCFYLRSIDDSRALRAAMLPSSRLVVIGAGFIGLEVAAAARARGAAVTVIEAGPAPLGRVAPPLLQDYVHTLHVGHGVDFRFGAAVDGMEHEDGSSHVRLADGDMVAGDIVVAGVGAVPNAELAADAGIACGRGILVDGLGATSDPFVFAVGDVAEQEHPALGRHVLLESWQNAQDQAAALGALLAGIDPVASGPAIPWFWSDQYDRNIQIYGLAEPRLDWVERGARDGRAWMAIGLTEGRIRYAAGVNAGRDLRGVRELMKIGGVVDAGILGDSRTKIMELVKSARLPYAA